MRKTMYILHVKEKSHNRPSYNVAVETWLFLGFIPVWQRQFLLGTY